MRHKPKVVFDTNIFISAIVFGGNPRVCLEIARSGEIELYTSSTLLLELSGKLKSKFKWDDAGIREAVEGIGEFARLVKAKSKVEIIKDDDSDNRVLECAKEAEADFIVSGDKRHVLPLKKFGKTLIVTSREFLDEFYQKIE